MNRFRPKPKVRGIQLPLDKNTKPIRKPLTTTLKTSILPTVVDVEPESIIESEIPRIITGESTPISKPVETTVSNDSNTHKSRKKNKHRTTRPDSQDIKM